MIGLEGIKSIKDMDLTEKIVFLRLDLNVPIQNGKVSDETRIRESLPTIKLALEKGAKLVVSSHLGRPKSADDRQYSLEPVAARLTECLNREIILVDDPASEAVETLIKGMKKGQLVLLENLRFDPGETENSMELAQCFAKYTQVYINDAFGASHRAHASIDALPRLIENRGMGLLIEKEISVLQKLLSGAEKPYWAILGGSKVSDKIGVIDSLVDQVDGFIIGGAMAYTFVKAKGKAVGKSRIEIDRLSYARDLMTRLESRGKSMLLPVDHVCATDMKSTEVQICENEIPEHMMGLDIGPKSIINFSEAIKGAKTIFWNGPMGVFENPLFCKGTFALAELMSGLKSFRVIGGGDSAAAVEAAGCASKMSHISTGGGASLEFLQGDQLPGLEALKPRKMSNK